MKKTFKMEDLDCANCASKMETRINKIKGVTNCTISFMTQRITIEAEDEGFDQILIKAQKEIRKVEPDTKIII